MLSVFLDIHCIFFSDQQCIVTLPTISVADAVSVLYRCLSFLSDQCNLRRGK